MRWFTLRKFKVLHIFRERNIDPCKIIATDTVRRYLVYICVSIITVDTLNTFLEYKPFSFFPMVPDLMGHSKAKAIPLHAMKALGGIGGVAPTHYRPRH